ncbi:MAG: NAD(P)H-binding protein [Actinomycetota bacterium]|nr:NAD(P)H-binding protein [Actinomycetota bacterium]
MVVNPGRPVRERRRQPSGARLAETTSQDDVDVVTGAFSFTGRAIAELLLVRGRGVRTLSRTPAPAGSPVEAAPFAFDDPAALTESLRGSDTLYNTYWIRFPRGGSSFEGAVENTRTLLRCAADAGVRRFVHVSVSNPSPDSPLPYFRGKADVEQAVREAPLVHAIVRPTLIFGPKDILVNNIAWVLRRFPLFVVPGDGSYRVQPVSVQDTARLCVDAEPGAELDSAGPETYSFDELVGLIRSAVGGRARIVHAAPAVALGLARVVGTAIRDVLLTREETLGLMDSLLVSHDPPTGRDSFREWLEANAEQLGRRYVSELARNYRRAPI